MKNRNVSQNPQTKQKMKKRKNQANLGSRGSSFQFSEQAAAYDSVIRNPNQFMIGTGIKHSEYGSAVRVNGRQQLLLITTTATDSQLFVSGIGTRLTTNSMNIVPDAFNDRVALVSSIYQRYAFRKLRFTYVTRVGTTQVGSFALGYTSDSGTTAGLYVAPTYSTVQDFEPSVVVPFRKEVETLEVKFTGDRTWYTVIDTTGGAESQRQAIQGTLYGFPDIASIGAIQMGELYVDYVIDFYVPKNVNTNISLLGLFGDLGDFSGVLAKKFKTSDPEQKKILKDRFSKVLKVAFGDLSLISNTNAFETSKFPQEFNF